MTMQRPTSASAALRGSRRRFLGGLAAGFAGALTLGRPARVAAGHHGSKGFVYVEGNDPAGNVILGFKQQRDGSLVPLPGSPYPAGGLGVGPTFNLGPFDSDQNMAITPDHKLLFAVNGGSDTIAVFRIRHDGALVPVPGSPFPSGGTNPVSVDYSDGVLLVVNKAQDPSRPGVGVPNYSTFLVDDDDDDEPLTLVPVSTIETLPGTSPSQGLFAPDDRLAFGCDFFGGHLRSFSIRRRGQLRQVDFEALPASEFAGTGQPALPLGLAVHPDCPLLYVGFVTISRIGVFRHGHAGDLHFVRGVPDQGKGPCWLRVNRDGSRLYASNVADNSAVVYDLDDPARPAGIQHVALNGPGGTAQIALSPDDRFFYVIDQRVAAAQPDAADALHVFDVDEDGMLAEVPSSPLPLPPATPGARAQGVLAI